MLEVEQYPLISFEVDSFRTGRIQLPGLNLWIDLKTTQYFRYDGPQKDLTRYVATLPGRMRFPVADLDITECGAFNHAYTWPFKNGPFLGYFMAVKDVSSRANVSNEAHEAAELASLLGLTNKLEEFFGEVGFPVSLKNLTRPQVGVVAGFIGARMHGYDVTDLYQDQAPDSYRLLVELGHI